MASVRSNLKTSTRSLKHSRRRATPQEIATAVATVVAGYANEAYAPPDPLGIATIWNNGGYGLGINLASQDNNDEDTFTPSWPGDPATGNVLGWKGPFTKDWRIRIALTDEDLVDDDSIGVIEVGYDDIVAALEYGKVVLRTSE